MSVAYQCDIPGGLRLLREVASTRKLIASQHNYYNTAEWSLVMPQRERSKWRRKMAPYCCAIKLTFVMNIIDVTCTLIWPDISNLHHEQYEYATFSNVVTTLSNYPRRLCNICICRFASCIYCIKSYINTLAFSCTV